MSTREKAIEIVNLMTEEQLQGFIMMFDGYAGDVPNAETKAAMKDIEQGKNLSKECSF